MNEINKNLYNNILEAGKKYETITDDELLAVKTPYNHPYFNVALITNNFEVSIIKTTQFFENVPSRIILSQESQFERCKICN